MSSRRQRSIPLSGRHRQVSLYHFHAAERLTGVAVKASDIRPPIENSQELDEEEFLLCGRHTAHTSGGQIIKIYCKPDTDGRYVYVHLPGTNYLSLCEVEIYGVGKLISFFLIALQDMNKQRVLMHTHQGWNVRHGLCHIYMRYLYIYMSCL